MDHLKDVITHIKKHSTAEFFTGFSAC